MLENQAMDNVYLEEKSCALGMIGWAKAVRRNRMNFMSLCQNVWRKKGGSSIYASLMNLCAVSRMNEPNSKN